MALPGVQFPDTLDAAKRAPAGTLYPRLHNGAGSRRTLKAFFDRVDALGGNMDEADERGQEVLAALVDYATEIAPERN